MERKIIIKVVAILILVAIIIATLIVQKQYNDQFDAGEDYGYLGEESTGDIPRLLSVDNRQGLDEIVSSTNSDRMFNQAYIDQYNDSTRLSDKAHLDDYTATKDSASATLAFNNGSVVEVNFKNNPKYVGDISVSTNIIKSVK